MRGQAMTVELFQGPLARSRSKSRTRDFCTNGPTTSPYCIELSNHPSAVPEIFTTAIQVSSMSSLAPSIGHVG